MQVKEIMSPHVDWVTPKQTIQEIAIKMRDEDIGCLPVGENDRLIGMITDRDIACRAVADGCDPTTTTAKEMMTEGMMFCFEDEDINVAIESMEKKQLHRLTVLNRDKRMVGMLSLGDLALHCSHDLSGEVLEAISKHIH